MEIPNAIAFSIEPTTPMSLQDILKRRQQSEFVGREEQVNIFRRNLDLPPQDDRRRFFFNLYGQGGVGKTCLIQQFRKIAEEAQAISGSTNEDEPDVPMVMGRIAEQFEQQGHPLQKFNERYRTYRQCRQQLEADPEAPQGISALVGQTIAKAGMTALKPTPAGLVSSLIDEDTLAKQVGQWTAFVAKKLSNKDEVLLVQQPLVVLCPLFLEGLARVSSNHSIALFFDTYERTGAYLDEWLRDLLEERYGSMPENIVVAIAGQDPLEWNNWTPYESLIARIPLEPFTEPEAREYLDRKGITDAGVVEAILRLSGRLPLLLATLAVGRLTHTTAVDDPAETAVERFLLWVDEAQQRQVAIDAALPRYLNQDVLAVLVGTEEATSLFDWLKEMPFVSKKSEYWAYHPVVRELMLRYKRQQSGQSWTALHEKLTNYYQNLADKFGLDAESRKKNPTWQGYRLEILYHHLCQSPQTSLPAILNQFLATFKNQRLVASRWAETIHQAGKDTGVTEVQNWGQQLIEGLKAYDEECYETAIAMFDALLASDKLEAEWRGAALNVRGNLYRRLEQYPKALVDLNEAIALANDEAKYYADRGVTHLLIQSYSNALGDLDRALALKPNDPTAIASRGWLYLLQEQYPKALEDFNQALELKPDYEACLVSRAVAYRQIGHYSEALVSLNRAIKLNPNNWVLLRERGTTYQEMERCEEALADFGRVLQFNPNDGGAIAGRGVASRQLGYDSQALEDFQRLLTLDPNDVAALANRGETYRQRGRYPEALTDLSRVLELNPDDPWALGIRGTTYRQLGQYQAALVDLERAIGLEPENDWWFCGRALVYRVLGQLEEMHSDLTIAIQLALKKYPPDSNNGRICLNLALYYLATGENQQEAQKIYKEALEVASLTQVREAIRDLNDFLTVEPNCPQTNSIRELLQEKLWQSQNLHISYFNLINQEP